MTGPAASSAPAKAKSPAAPYAAPPKNKETSDEQAAIASFHRIRKIIRLQSGVIGVLSLLLLLMLPLMQPIYTYYARKPEGQIKQLVALTIPNMTNRAVLSWATTSITEIMTLGFGDMDYKLPKQKSYFTQEGWESYVKAFSRMKIVQTFKQSRMVLTTVPSNTPVILFQGPDDDKIYQWIVQMPIIMTYATNNNVEKQQTAIVTLTIVRVPVDINSSGVAIKTWVIG